MEVVILCGGDSLRFRNPVIPSSKVMAPVAGTPLVEHIMNHYFSYGFREFILCVKDSDSEITNYFHEHSKFKKVSVIKTGDDTPTGGRLKKIEAYIKNDLFMVSYGDGLSNVDLDALLDFHKTHGKKASLTAVQPHHQFGILEINQNQHVVNFIEKPQMNEWINGGFFVFNKQVFQQLEEDHVLETNLLYMLASQRELLAFHHKGFWKSMDTLKDYEDLNQLLSL